MTKMRSLFLTLAAVVALAGCKPELDAPTLDSGRADFSRPVVMGGSMLAGYQDGALYREGQFSAAGWLVASYLNYDRQAIFNSPILETGVSLGINPKPWESQFQSQSMLGDRVDCEGEVSMGPVKTELSLADVTASGALDVEFGTMQNICLPGAGMSDLTNNNLAAGAPDYGPATFWSRYSGSGSTSPVEYAAVQEPTFLIFAPGTQDIFNWAATGGALSPLPDPAAFRVTLDSILNYMSSTSGPEFKGVLSTIPDMGVMPFFTTIPARGLELSQELADSLNDIYALGNIDVQLEEGANGFIVQDNAATPPYRQMTADEYIGLTIPLDSVRCYFMGVLIQTMPDRYTLIRSELDDMRSVVAQMNSTIEDLAIKYDFALADVAGFYNDLQSGIVRDGVEFNAEFVSGNYFSLDGYGPTPKGSALLANVYIEAINTHFGSNVPPVRLDVRRAVLFP